VSAPSHRATVSVTFVALSVQTSGRKSPLALANPATAPTGRGWGWSTRANTVPDVPSEIATSPARKPSPSAAPMLSPVPGPTTTPGGSPSSAAAASVTTPATAVGASTAGRCAPGRPVAGRELEQVVVHASGRRIEPATARRVAAVGHVLTGEPPGQVVVREHHAPGPCEQLRFVLGHPGELGDRERRDRDAAGELGPPGGPDLGDEPVGLWCGSCVVPELGRPHRQTGVVEQDEPVLLAGHRDRDYVAAGVAEETDGVDEGCPPRAWILFGHRRARGRVPCRPGGDDLAGVEPARLDLDGLGRRVDPDDDCALTISVCAWHEQKSADGVDVAGDDALEQLLAARDRLGLVARREQVVVELLQA
jgi:hypothetical protein